jgi:AAA domain
MTSRLTIKISRISYLGPEKVAASIDFEAGLNIVCGSSETGKSFIVETIDFMLGGQSELRDLPERVGYDRVVMWVSFSNGQKFTIRRSMQGGGYRWRTGHHKDLSDTDETLRPTHGDKDDNLSHRLLKLLELNGRRLRKDKDSSTVSFTIRHLAHLSIVNETRIFDTLSPVLTRNRAVNTIEKAAFKLVLTGVDDSSLVAIKEARDTQTRIVANRNTLASLIEIANQDFPLPMR